jgi:hypothetical protein
MNILTNVTFKAGEIKMLITISEAMLTKMNDYLDRLKNASDRYQRLTESLCRAARTARANKYKLGLYKVIKKIKAIVIKILCNVNLFDHNTHLITENILTQNTYYKTLTSRP